MINVYLLTQKFVNQFLYNNLSPIYTVISELYSHQNCIPKNKKNIHPQECSKLKII